MGIVVEATNIQLGQRVAVKLLRRGADDPAIVERFSNEARAAARLKSEHVARVFDVGSDETHGPFIVMEMLEGKTLAELLAAGERVSLHRAVEYVIDACEGLAEAHARGIVHQDVKPANLFVVTGGDGRPTVKLLDFGIATMHARGEPANARSSHATAGTPAYLAPEQLRAAGPIDHRADVWALGCVLYELLVGARAFRAARFTELVTAILETAPHPFPPDAEVSPTVQAITKRCLEKDPAGRFSSTGALALALLPFARRRAHTAVSRAVSHVKNAGLDPTLEMPSSMPPRPSEDTIDPVSGPHLRPPSVPSFPEQPAASPTRTPSPVFLVGAAALAVAGGIAAFTWTRAKPSDAPSAAVVGSATPSAQIAAPSSSSPPPPREERESESSAATPVTASEKLAPRPVPSTIRRPRPVASVPAAPSPSTASSTDSEIRHTR
jgi:serine/threonine-protein kinase